MNKILDIAERLKEKQREEQIQANRRKLETLQRTIHCSLCSSKCAMCGHHSSTGEMYCPSETAATEINLCESCREEFDAFLSQVGGKEGRRMFWHNKEWVQLWSAWLDYREAILSFRRSYEFRRLIQELDL